MSSDTKANQKICSGCGKDLAGLPRRRTPKGKYYCDPCYDAARAEHRDLGLLADAVRDDEAHGHHRSCPACGESIDPTSVVCLKCGYSEQAGKKVRTQVAYVRPKRERRTFRIIIGGGKGLMSAIVSPMGVALAIGLGLFALFVLAQNGGIYLQIYLYASFAFAVMCSITARIYAFQDSTADGLMVFFLPPYELLYVFVLQGSLTLRACYILAAAFVGLVFTFEDVPWPW